MSNRLSDSQKLEKIIKLEESILNSYGVSRQLLEAELSELDNSITTVNLYSNEKKEKKSNYPA